MGRIFSTLSLLGIGLWAGKRLHIGDYLRRKRGPAVTTNEAKTAFSKASEIISSLYKHFLIFDLTYVASGMVLLLVVCYAAFATSMKGVPRGEGGYSEMATMLFWLHVAGSVPDKSLRSGLLQDQAYGNGI
jgi:hypothetical protein